MNFILALWIVKLYVQLLSWDESRMSWEWFSRKYTALDCLFVKGSCDRKLTEMRDEMATDLFELEEEYYSSSYK